MRARDWLTRVSRTTREGAERFEVSRRNDQSRIKQLQNVKQL